MTRYCFKLVVIHWASSWGGVFTVCLDQWSLAWWGSERKKKITLDGTAHNKIHNTKKGRNLVRGILYRKFQICG